MQQYEVVFSDAFISDVEANLIISRASSTIHDAPQSSSTKNLETATAPKTNQAFDPAHETYEVMILDDEQYLCTIPIVDPPLKNETSEAEARAAEQKELARATDRGWELLQDLEGNCLYFVSGWWSYSFCYNNEIVQFHQLPPQPGKPLTPPARDPTTKQFVLGKAKAGQQSKEDEWGNEIDVHKGPKHGEPPKTELQVKGDTRYLVQRMEGGTTCDLTGKPRRVEVQYHCNPHVTDRIGYIKEVTTCSYQMVIYTPRLCTDAAFMPAKESTSNEIVCRVIVPEDDMEDRTELKMLENELDAANAKIEKPINIGGIIVGGGKWAAKDGARMPIPANFGQEDHGRVVEIIARAKPKSEGGQVEMATEADLRKLDLDPATVDELRKEVQKMAKDKGWEIKVVDEPGEIRTILGVVDEEDDDEEGSEEIYKDEL
jgi:protein OS-9